MNLASPDPDDLALFLAACLRTLGVETQLVYRFDPKRPGEVVALDVVDASREVTLAILPMTPLELGGAVRQLLLGSLNATARRQAYQLQRGTPDHVALWEAIHAYVRACGGYPESSSQVLHDAILRVAGALEGVVARRLAEREAARTPCASE